MKSRIKYNKKIILSLIFLFYIKIKIWGIGGLSGTKLVIPSAKVLDKGKSEIDLNFFILNSHQQYDEAGKLISYSVECNGTCKRDKISEGGLSFRTTGGIGNGWEIGIEGGHNTMKNEISDFTFSYIDDLKFGFKWNFFHQKESLLHISFQQGITYDYDSFTPWYESGFLISKDWSHISMDWDIHYFFTKRIQIMNKGNLEQMDWYRGPHFGFGISYELENLLLAFEYHYEEAQTHVKQYHLWSDTEYKNFFPETIFFSIEFENPQFHSILGLPESISIENINIPLEKISKKRKYFTISRSIHYGISYQISKHVSFSFIIHDVIGGSNVDDSFALNTIVTFLIF